MTFCNYVWRDPKDGVVRYVGWSSNLRRPHRHRYASNNTHLGRVLRKRIQEGYDPQPEIVVCPIQSATYAKLVECCWIEKYGRLDLGTGTLFNHTDGGDGTCGRKATDEQRAVLRAIRAARTAEEEAAITAKRLATMGPDGLKAATRKAKETLGPEGRKAAAYKAQETKGPEGRKAAALNAGAASAAVERTCPHCDKTGHGGGMITWHFDNCKHRP